MSSSREIARLTTVHQAPLPARETAGWAVRHDSRRTSHLVSNETQTIVLKSTRTLSRCAKQWGLWCRTWTHKPVAGKVLSVLQAVPRTSMTGESYTDAELFDRTGRLASAERRRNFRAPLHWTVYLAYGGSGPPIRTTTRDINKDGFYCLLDQPVTPGQRIECNIVVPMHRSQDPD